MTRTALEAVASAYAQSNATIIPYGMGITQHTKGTSNVQQLANLLLMRGNIGKPGAGICPLRGHSNVQGDRTVGITEKPGADMLARIEATFGFKPPAAHGHDAVEAMQAMVDGQIESADLPRRQSRRCHAGPGAMLPGDGGLDLAVHIATKFNRSHLLVGKEAIILPCLGRTEYDIQASGPQMVTVEDSMSMVHSSRGKLPAGVGASALRARDRRRDRGGDAAAQAKSMDAG